MNCLGGLGLSMRSASWGMTAGWRRQCLQWWQYSVLSLITAAVEPAVPAGAACQLVSHAQRWSVR